MTSNKRGTTSKKMSTAKSSSKSNLNQLKMQSARDVGVTLNQGGYNGHLTAKQAGMIGGQMVKHMVEKYENSTTSSTGKRGKTNTGKSGTTTKSSKSSRTSKSSTRSK